jgi:hypothetical protein
VSGQVQVTRTPNRLILEVHKGECPKTKRLGVVELVPQPSMLGARDLLAWAPLHSRVNTLFWSRPWFAKYVLRRTFKG